MNDKVQNQPPPQPPNVGMNPQWNPWQGMQNPYQQRPPYPYWPQQWMSPYPMNMQMTGGLLPHPQMPYQGMNMQNFNYPQSQQNAGGNNNQNGNNMSKNNSNDNTNPPLPGSDKNEANDKPVENPDKIPLPDGPPPPDIPFPPLPPNTLNQNSSPRMFFKPNNQPVRFNLNQQNNHQQNKGFISFNLPNKKNKRKKNKNQQAHPFASLFNNKMNTNMPMPMNFTPPKPYSTVQQAPPLPPLPSGAPPIPTSQDNNSAGDVDMKKDATNNQGANTPTIAAEWPPSLL